MIYIVGLGTPVMAILLGALAKKLTRGGPLLLSDFFLGIELCIASITSLLVYLSDPRRLEVSTEPDGLLAGYAVANLVFFLLVISVHQQFENGPYTNRLKSLMLGVFGNTTGILLLASFILFVRAV